MKSTNLKRKAIKSSVGYTSSFYGVRGNSIGHFIEVEMENDWLTVTQAQKLMRDLYRHIQRIEAHLGKKSKQKQED